jgi:hypothetical protein
VNRFQHIGVLQGEHGQPRGFIADARDFGSDVGVENWSRQLPELGTVIRVAHIEVERPAKA